MREKSLPSNLWLSVEDASHVLGVTPLNLRRKLEAHARRTAGGVIEATLEGATGRKWGRLWRVALDQGWLEPSKSSGGAP